jgi:hypothetical protein
VHAWTYGHYSVQQICVSDGEDAKNSLVAKNRSAARE